MANYSTNELKPGLKVMIDGEPSTILESEFVKPGKGQAFTRVKLRNLRTFKVWDRTYKSGESVEAADVLEKQAEFLYSDGNEWHFMDTDNYEQYQVTTEVMGDTIQWLKEQTLCDITFWNNEAIMVVPPNFVELEVVKTDPGVRGDTATGGNKPAELSSGAVVKVPLFVEEGEIIRVDTRKSEYQGRVKS